MQPNALLCIKAIVFPVAVLICAIRHMHELISTHNTMGKGSLRAIRCRLCRLSQVMSNDLQSRYDLFLSKKVQTSICDSQHHRSGTFKNYELGHRAIDPRVNHDQVLLNTSSMAYRREFLCSNLLSKRDSQYSVLLVVPSISDISVSFLGTSYTRLSYHKDQRSLNATSYQSLDPAYSDI